MIEILLSLDYDGARQGRAFSSQAANGLAACRLRRPRVAATRKNSRKSDDGDRPRNWPVSSRVARVSRARHAGPHVLAILAVLLGGSAACRSSTQSSHGRTAAPVRGGALVASIRSEPRTFNRYVDNSGVADATTA